MNREFGRLAGETFDLLVIGGGIYGAWSAYDASLRGLRVALVEQADWGARASSASSKLIHGGLRYLEHFHLRLVRKSLAERRLLARIAPHRVRPMRFVLPVRPGARPGRVQLAAGLALYDMLAGDAQPCGKRRSLDASEMKALCPFLALDAEARGFEFGDCVTDDARFVVEIVTGAAAAGAVMVSRCPARRLLRTAGRVVGAEVTDLESGSVVPVRAAVVLDATGARAGQLRDAAPAARPLVRMSKGVHLVLPGLATERAVLLVARSDRRPIFLIPWYGRTLLGTTDTDFEGDPADARPEAHDRDYLLSEANAALAGGGWREEDVIAAFAGVRALRYERSGRSADVARDWSLEAPEERLLVSVGGKLTAARADAQSAIDRVLAILGRPVAAHPTETTPTPWAPSGDLAAWIERTRIAGQAAGLDAQTALGVAWRYGTSVDRLFPILREAPALAQRLDPDAPFCAGEVVHALRHEMARSLDDVVRRRLPLALVCRSEGNALAHAARIVDAELRESPVRDR